MPEPAPSPERLEDLAVSAARAAASLIRECLGGAVSLRQKSSPTDIVTQTDVEAEALIRAGLSEATPDARFLGEEGGATGSQHSVLTWIIDPLDGTVNFLYGLPVIGVSIAAATDGIVVAGAVVDVLRDEVFSASIGRGSRVDGAAMKVSTCTDIAQAMVTTGFSYSAALRKQQGELVGGLIPLVRDIRCFGSAALQLCWVGMGRVDAYFDRDTKLWDYAAAALIAAEAGATVELPCPENDSLVIGAPPPLFASLRDLVDYPAPDRSLTLP